MALQTVLTPLLFISLLLTSHAKKIAIVGGGISGTFAAKYLADYDQNCTLDSISIFDPLPIGEPTKVTQKGDVDWQGSRVASLELEDGSVVELGASVAFDGFQLVMEMIRADDTIVIGEAHNAGPARVNDTTRGGIGIYNGNGVWSLLTTYTSTTFSSILLLWRYNVDFYKMYRASGTAQRGLQRIQKWLNSTYPTTFFESPDEMWEAGGLLKPAHLDFDTFLDAIGLPQELPWWRRYLPYQGSLRAELLTAINLCNYNQANSQVNGLVGVGSFISAKVELFSIVGGNYQIVKSALSQAKRTLQQNCNGKSIVNHVAKRVTSVVADLEKMELFSNEESLGSFDVVILAAPIQQSRISFLVKSDKDDSVLHDMPLFGEYANMEELEARDLQKLSPTKLPDSVSRSYTQVITTVVSNATLIAKHFQLDNDKDLPRGIYMTEQGRESEFGITAISQITSDGVYKIFSSNVLEEQTLSLLFGHNYNVEYVKVWGGKYGGATPDYRGEGKTVKYTIYDSSAQVEGYLGSVLYYPNAIEASFACMELSAIGAKSVARLAAKRLGLLVPRDVRQEQSNEL